MFIYAAYAGTRGTGTTMIRYNTAPVFNLYPSLWGDDAYESTDTTDTTAAASSSREGGGGGGEQEDEVDALQSLIDASWGIVRGFNKGSPLQLLSSNYDGGSNTLTTATVASSSHSSSIEHTARPLSMSVYATAATITIAQEEEEEQQQWVVLNRFIAAMQHLRGGGGSSRSSNNRHCSRYYAATTGMYGIYDAHDKYAAHMVCVHAKATSIALFTSWRQFHLSALRQAKAAWHRLQRRFVVEHARSSSSNGSPMDDEDEQQEEEGLGRQQQQLALHRTVWCPFGGRVHANAKAALMLRDAALYACDNTPLLQTAEHEAHSNHNQRSKHCRPVSQGDGPMIIHRIDVSSSSNYPREEYGRRILLVAHNMLRVYNWRLCLGE